MWSADGFAHVRQAATQVEERVKALQAILAHGSDLADPETVHEAARGVEDALEGLWAPVVWDEALGA